MDNLLFYVSSAFVSLLLAWNLFACWRRQRRRRSPGPEPARTPCHPPPPPDSLPAKGLRWEDST